MTRRRYPTKRAISQHHARPIDECWACGAPGAVERCHIVAHSAGGPACPSNFALMCRRCHKDQPDGAPADVQWAWVAAREHHMSRELREFRPAIEWAIAGMSAAAVDAVTPDVMADLIDRAKAADCGGGSGSGNETATFQWNLAAALRQWAQARDE